MTVTVEGVGRKILLGEVVVGESVTLEVVEASHVYLALGSKGEAFVEWEDIEGSPRIASLSAEIESKTRELAQTIREHMATVTEVHGETYWSLH